MHINLNFENGIFNAPKEAKKLNEMEESTVMVVNQTLLNVSYFASDFRCFTWLKTR